jgi:hypothetical protein
VLDEYPFQLRYCLRALLVGLHPAFRSSDRSHDTFAGESAG